MEKKRLTFRRQNWFRFKRLGEKWRKPRGRDSRQRVRAGGKSRRPSIGYRVPNKIRDLHPSGLAEVMVQRPVDLAKMNASQEAARIAASVGMRTREQILIKAKELRIKVLNPGVKKHETRLKEKTGS